MTTKRTRRPTPAAVSRALTVIAQHGGLTTIPNADLKTLRAQAAAVPPVDSLDRDLAAMTGLC